jgi:hypothetical protein
VGTPLEPEAAIGCDAHQLRVLRGRGEELSLDREREGARAAVEHSDLRARGRDLRQHELRHLRVEQSAEIADPGAPLAAVQACEAERSDVRPGEERLELAPREPQLSARPTRPLEHIIVHDPRGLGPERNEVDAPLRSRHHLTVDDEAHGHEAPRLRRAEGQGDFVPPGDDLQPLDRRRRLVTPPRRELPASGPDVVDVTGLAANDRLGEAIEVAVLVDLRRP